MTTCCRTTKHITYKIQHSTKDIFSRQHTQRQRHSQPVNSYPTITTTNVAANLTQYRHNTRIFSVGQLRLLTRTQNESSHSSNLTKNKDNTRTFSVRQLRLKTLIQYESPHTRRKEQRVADKQHAPIKYRTDIMVFFT
jgi:hypothetical protein